MKSTTLDPVVEEVRERGRRWTARLGHDPRRIVEALQEEAALHPERYVSEIRVVKAADPIEPGLSGNSQVRAPSVPRGSL
ncbi:MAG: hypothetical protein HY814_08160 [Candidatus Riflebacteria bacterium]|nr:hypothetical protein [Candidatus Riflebacteria bacterium]